MRLIVLLVGSALATAPAPAAGQRRGGALDTVLHVAALLRAAPGGGEPTAEFADLVDVAEVGRRVLGVHYQGLSLEQRGALERAITAYAAAAYQHQAPELGRFELRCSERKVNDTFADVRCDVDRRGERVALTVLLRRSDRWRVFDVQTPSFGLIRSNTERADRSIRQEGFAGYLRRIDRRVDDQKHPDQNDRILQPPGPATAAAQRGD